MTRERLSCFGVIAISTFYRLIKVGRLSCLTQRNTEIMPFNNFLMPQRITSLLPTPFRSRWETSKRRWLDLCEKRFYHKLRHVRYRREKLQSLEHQAYQHSTRQMHDIVCCGTELHVLTIGTFTWAGCWPHQIKPLCTILYMQIRSPRIILRTKEKSHSRWWTASYWTWRSPFTNVTAIFWTLSSVWQSRERIGEDACIAYSSCGRILNALYQGEENTRLQGRDGLRKVKKHAMGF